MTDARWVNADGLATVRADGTTLDAWFPQVHAGRRPATTDLTALQPHAGVDERREVSLEVISIETDLDAPVSSTADAYLRLHALSLLLVRPNEVNLEGIFGHLPNVAWTTAGPMHPDDVTARRPALVRAGIQVQGLDKFPRLTDYVLPDGVRIADASRVRLGAHLSPGTTIMHEGFVNFNAGTLGAVMVEGRLSQGVVVQGGTDIGAGASTMGTLSGGGTQRVSVGARSLIGANAGIGIAIGDDCVVEAGLYVTAGTKVTTTDDAGEAVVVKAAVLSGVNGLLFLRNSQTGAVEARRRSGVGVTLNDALHA
ncbi:DapH/DapD/GlmU-related protein [Microbacterium gorillae]|uniref:DapH/DapD/GlmU-related protein n=1 Tax=Microbacterium gorillae TaxID=1231063 RepID=UPI000590C7A5|nr:DapH/DapD/GlmU-related protein [Microbacterium gorillae]